MLARAMQGSHLAEAAAKLSQHKKVAAAAKKAVVKKHSQKAHSGVTAGETSTAHVKVQSCSVPLVRLQCTNT